VLLWEALADTHPFWGVPLPEVAGAIARGAPPLSAKCPDLPRRLAAAVDAALAVDPARRTSAAQLADELREAYVVARPQRSERATPRRAPRAPAPRLEEPVPIERRAVPAGLAALAAAVGASILPFWPPGLIVALALAAGLATLRSPRLGMVLALAAPVFPLGNVAQGAAVAYVLVALAWLAVVWRDARAGLAFVAGPILAGIGLLMLLPLAVQPARGAWRRGLHAAVGTLAAAGLAGLAGSPLPLTGAVVGDLGITGTERPMDVVHAVSTLLASETPLLTTALALALAAAALPSAVARGLPGIAALGIAQVALIVLWAPGVPWLGVVLGTLVCCGILAARPVATIVAARRAAAEATLADDESVGHTGRTTRPADGS
jgi:hypothetical protein